MFTFYFFSIIEYITHFKLLLCIIYQSTVVNVYIQKLGFVIFNRLNTKIMGN